MSEAERGKVPVFAQDLNPWVPRPPQNTKKQAETKHYLSSESKARTAQNGSGGEGPTTIMLKF